MRDVRRDEMADRPMRLDLGLEQVSADNGALERDCQVIPIGPERPRSF